jgi:hypothetical protein
MMVQLPLGGKALIVSPAGEVCGRDDVQWYRQPQNEIETNYFNTGDMVVYDSTLKLLDLTEVRGTVIQDTPAAEIEAYRSYDFFLIRASNFIHNDMEWHQALELFEAVPLPIFAIGVGAQASSFGRYKLDDRNLRFWKTVAERSTLIGVRGTFTAEVLAANGIKNVEIVGCPSMFRARRRDLAIRPGATVERVAFSIRHEVGAGYATSVEHYREEQREMLLRFARRFALRLTTHGEVEEKAFVYRNAAGMQRARELFLRERWWTADTAAEMERLYADPFFFLKVSDYDGFIRTQDLAVGYRVHGVLPALANGVPGILVTYDARSAELADTHAIPAIAASEVAGIDPERLIAETSYDDFNKLFALRYDKMRFVLEQNGLPHRMG